MIVQRDSNSSASERIRLLGFLFAFVRKPGKASDALHWQCAVVTLMLYLCRLCLARDIAAGQLCEVIHKWPKGAAVTLVVGP